MAIKNLFQKKIPFTPLKKQIQVGGIIGFFVFFILWVFQPFGTYEFSIAFKSLFLLGYGVLTSVSYIVFFIAGIAIFPKWFASERWNLLKELFIFILVFNFMAFICLIYHHQFVGNYSITFSVYFDFLKYSALVGVLPFSVLYYQKWITLGLTTAEKTEHKEKTAPQNILFFSNNKKESPVVIPENEILFLKSEGNYVEIFSYRNGQLQKHFIRNTLNHVTTRLPAQNFPKVHRSYVVNKTYAKSIRLDGSGYELLFGIENIKVPVSRSSVKEIKSWFEAGNRQ